MKVEVKGFKELDAALAEFSKGTGKNILRRAGLDALGPVADTMRQKAPKDSRDLEEAVAVGSRRAKGAKKHFPGSSTVEVYAGVGIVGGGMPPQATQQEFGNEHHGPQPYARPAWDQEQRPTLERVKDSLAAQIDKSRERARRKAMKA